MFRSTLIATAFSLTLIAPAHADNNKCDEASWTAMMAEVDALTDAAQKEAATKELQMAKEMLAANDLDQCMVHMDNATKIYK